MIYSKFRVWPVVLVICISIALIFLSIFFVANYTPSNDTGKNIFFVFFTLFFVYFFLQMLFGELRTKAIKVVFDVNEVIKTSFFGIGFKSDYSYNELDGYKISMLSSRSGTYEYLYLLNNSKRVVKISEYYHANYHDLKAEVMKKDIKYLGKENWNIFIDMKDMFVY